MQNGGRIDSHARCAFKFSFLAVCMLGELLDHREYGLPASRNILRENCSQFHIYIMCNVQK